MSKESGLESEETEEQEEQKETKVQSVNKKQKASLLIRNEPKISPAEYRRMMEKRPPIKSIIG